MKKILAVLCSLLLLSYLATSGEEPVQMVHEITASPEAIAFREAIFSAYAFREKTDEQVMEDFQANSLPYLNSRTEQKFPDVETVNRLAKETHDYGDVYTLSGEKEDCVVLYIHGGAFVWEIRSQHVSFCDGLVDLLGAKVYMPIYPLAPQATYEESYEMVGRLYNELLLENKPIIIMGDSAGGTISLGFVLSLKESGKPLPEKVVLISPGSEILFSSDEIDDYEPKDGMLPRAECRECGLMWAAGADPKNPMLSPLYGDYRDFPDTMMIIGDCDITYPDDIRLFDKMCGAGINVSLVKGIGFFHVFPLVKLPEQEEIFQYILDFCK